MLPANCAIGMEICFKQSYFIDAFNRCFFLLSISDMYTVKLCVDLVLLLFSSLIFFVCFSIVENFFNGFSGKPNEKAFIALY